MLLENLLSYSELVMAHFRSWKLKRTFCKKLELYYVVIDKANQRLCCYENTYALGIDIANHAPL